MASMTLPSLLFGERTATTVRSVNQLQDMVAGTRGWQSAYTVLGDKSVFTARMAAMSINGTKLTHVAHTPMHRHVQSDHASTLFIPITGPENRSRVNGKEVSFSPEHTAAFAPEGEYSGVGGQSSVLMIDINKQRLRDTVSVMTGQPSAIAGDLKTPMSVNLRAGSFRFDQMLRHVCSMADQFCGAPELLNRSGLDDVIYRTLGTMFAPSALLRDATMGAFDEPQRFNAIRDFLMARLTEPVSLTDIERFSGLSARALQYVFASKAGMSPMAWLKQQRLLKARQLLQQPGAIQSITALALDLCFSSPSRFSAEYRKLFGCLPSNDLY